MSKISTVLWNYYYFDLSFRPKISFIVFLAEFLIHWKDCCHYLEQCLPIIWNPAYPCVCILGSDGSQVLILRSALPSPILPAQWGGRLVVHVLNMSIYACKSTGLFPVPFRIQDIVLAGRECRRSPSSAAHQSRALYIVWCRRWLWARDILQVPSSLWEGQCWSRLWAVWDSSCKGKNLFSPKGCSCW